MEDLRELQSEIKIKMNTYEEMIQSEYCNDASFNAYLQGKIEVLKEIDKKINSIFLYSR